MSEDRARGLREDTRQASGFGVAACKTTERCPSAFRRFDPVGFSLSETFRNPWERHFNEYILIKLRKKKSIYYHIIIAIFIIY